MISGQSALPIHLGIVPAAAIALLLTAGVFLTTRTNDYQGGFDEDGSFYAAMAGEPTLPAELRSAPPWCYRVLTPFLVSRLPLGVLNGFRLIAFLSDVSGLVILFLILRSLGFPASLSTLGMLLYAGVFWTLRFSFYSPAYIDAETQLVLLALLLATVRRQYWWLVPLLVISALQKESLTAYAFFSIAHFWRNRRRTPGDRWRWWPLALFASAIIPLVTVRLTTELLAPAATPHVSEELGHLFDPQFWPLLLAATLSGLGLLAPVMLLRWRPWTGFLREQWEWGVFLVISVVFLFGGADKSRLFLYLLPLAVVMVLRVAASLRETLPSRVFWAWAGALVITHSYLGGYFGPVPPYEEYLVRMVPEYSEGQYGPILVRNVAASLAFVALSLALIYRFRLLGSPAQKTGNPSEGEPS